MVKEQGIMSRFWTWLWPDIPEFLIGWALFHVLVWLYSWLAVLGVQGLEGSALTALWIAVASFAASTIGLFFASMGWAENYWFGYVVFGWVAGAAIGLVVGVIGLFIPAPFWPNMVTAFPAICIIVGLAGGFVFSSMHK